MDSKKYDFWVGAFVIVGVVALGILALKAGNLASINVGEKTYRISFRFDNIGGIKPHASIKSAGVIVGRIAEIKFDDKTYQATILADMDGRYKFPKDSSAKILTSGLLGEQFIGLEAGAEADFLTQGDRVKQTQSAIVLEDLIGKMVADKLEGKKEDPKPTEVKNAKP